MPFPKKNPNSKGNKGMGSNSGSAEHGGAPTAIPKSILPDASSPNNCKLVVSAKPNSKENAIEAVDDECVSVHIAEEPKDGKANTELVEYLAEVLGVKKRDISLDKGSRSHNKLFLVMGVAPAQAHQKLTSEIKK